MGAGGKYAATAAGGRVKKKEALRGGLDTAAAEDLVRRFAPPSPEGKAVLVPLRGGEKGALPGGQRSINAVLFYDSTMTSVAAKLFVAV